MTLNLSEPDTPSPIAPAEETPVPVQMANRMVAIREAEGNVTPERLIADGFTAAEVKAHADAARDLATAAMRRKGGQ